MNNLNEQKLKLYAEVINNQERLIKQLNILKQKRDDLKIKYQTDKSIINEIQELETETELLLKQLEENSKKAAVIINSKNK